jgi:hypothetical protein
MFARFYEQYISNKTNDDKLKNQLNIKMSEIPIGYYNDTEFKILSDEFDNVLKKVGWL